MRVVKGMEEVSEGGEGERERKRERERDKVRKEISDVSVSCVRTS